LDDYVCNLVTTRTQSELFQWNWR